jgi:hypothetical protein
VVRETRRQKARCAGPPRARKRFLTAVSFDALGLDSYSSDCDVLGRPRIRPIVYRRPCWRFGPELLSLSRVQRHWASHFVEKQKRVVLDGKRIFDWNVSDGGKAICLR